MNQISLSAQTILDIATGKESNQECLNDIRELQPWQWLDEDQLKQVASLKVLLTRGECEDHWRVQQTRSRPYVSAS